MKDRKDGLRERERARANRVSAAATLPRDHHDGRVATAPRDRIPQRVAFRTIDARHRAAVHVVPEHHASS